MYTSTYTHRKEKWKKDRKENYNAGKKTLGQQHLRKILYSDKVFRGLVVWINYIPIVLGVEGGERGALKGVCFPF